MIVDETHAYKELISTTNTIVRKEGNTWESREKICKKLSKHPAIKYVSDFAMSNTVTFFVTFADGTEKIVSITV